MTTMPDAPATPSRRPSARRIARVTRSVRRAARIPCPTPRPCDLPGWSSTLRAALEIAPELPARAFVNALTCTAGMRGVRMVFAVAENPESLAHLAAILARHGHGRDTISPGARRRAEQLLRGMATPCASVPAA